MAKKSVQKTSDNDQIWLWVNIGTTGVSASILALFLGAPSNPASIGIIFFYPIFIAAFGVCLGTLGFYIPLTLMRHHNDLRKTTIAHFLFILSFLFLNLIKFFPSHDRTMASYNNVVWTTLGFFVPFYIVRRVCWKYFSKHQLMHKLTLLITAIGYLFFLYFN